jgi:histidinol-phosphatase (PHP family)
MTCDLHIHSQYSFDGTASLEAICESARNRGVDIIALTDHCDMLDGPEGISAYLACEQELKKRYAELEKNELQVLYGVELGNPHEFPRETEAFLARRKFDFIIGSIHFLPDGSDIYKLPYSTPEEIDDMFRQHFRSMRKLVEYGGFDTLAHMDYPIRKLQGKLSSVSIRAYRDLIEPILQILVEKGIALEINTRGTYDWQNRVGPEDWVLEHYRKLGGKYVTIGSDAHVAKYVGAGFAEAAAALKRAGFDSYTVYKDRCPVQIPLEK